MICLNAGLVTACVQLQCSNFNICSYVIYPLENIYKLHINKVYFSVYLMIVFLIGVCISRLTTKFNTLFMLHVCMYTCCLKVYNVTDLHLTCIN